MTKALLLTVLLAFAASSVGCSVFKRNRARESSSIASDVEQTFRQRWVDKRISEITAQGIAPDAARRQAETEFQERFAFAGSAKQK